MKNANLYLESVKKQMLYYKTIADKAIAQLESEQLFTTPHENTNSIAIIIQHIAGNMISRWTDFLTSDGEKEWRNRDAEFENHLISKETLLILWEKGWKCFFNTINTLKPDNLNQIIYIRNEEQTVIDAINRQLAHYPYHIGQIVFYAKMIKNEHWDNLSIPKNQSKEYNTNKFLKENNLPNL
ncbi:DUF1572 domain-containing protein [Flavobacterium columnare]|uniref:DUF1572 domain-containing protein n=1 Tax=Flavobacterium columnare TaxID=996 RepID=A0A437UA05_9FLAO|nr:DUF1572 family protein [Flavobacterium columnare]RVU90454.1 DUF1572 domain-containing protein [Flavobacterium columnare]